MAERVDIDIPGIGTIEAKNAASEATLIKILEALEKAGVSSSRSTGSSKNNAQKGIDSLGLAASKTSKSIASNAKNSTAIGAKVNASFAKLGARLNVVTFAASAVFGAFSKVTEVSTRLVSSLSNVEDSVAGAARSLNEIPLVGQFLSTTMTAAAEAAEKVVKSYSNAASVGATFGGDMLVMSRAATISGMTIDNFTNLIKNSGETLMLLGGTTEEGALRLAKANRAMRDTGLVENLYNLGYSTADINKGMADYIKVTAMSGNLEKKSTKDLAEGSAKYLKELDMLAKITGKSREEQQSQREALLRDGQIRSFTAQMGEQAQADLLAVIQSLGPSVGAAAKDIIITGTATSKEAQDLISKSGEMFNTILGMRSKILAGEKLTQETLNDFTNEMTDGAKIYVDRWKKQTDYDPEFRETFYEIDVLAKQSKDRIKKAMEEQEAAYGDKNLANAMSSMGERIAQISNHFKNALTNTGLLDGLMVSFEMVAKVVDRFMVPVLKLAGDLIHYGLVPAFKGIMYVIDQFVAPAFSSIGNAITEVASFMNKIYMPIFSMVGRVMKDYYEILSDFLMPAFSWLGKLFENHINPVVEKVSNWFVTLWKNMSSAADSFNSIRDVVDLVKLNFNEFGFSMKEMWANIKDYLSLILGGTSEEERRTLEMEKQALLEQRGKLENRLESQRSQNEADRAAREKEADEERAKRDRDYYRFRFSNEKKLDDLNVPEVDMSSSDKMFYSLQNQQNPEYASTVSGTVPTESQGPATTANVGPTPVGTKGMLEQIARGEGTSDAQAQRKGLKSGYDVSLGYGAYGGGPEKPLSEMTMAEVKAYQKRMLADPKNKFRSSAVGKYQFISGTLAGLQKEMGLKDTDTFSPEVQDKMGEMLLKRRGMDKYLSGKMSEKDFQLGLAREWASVADPRTGKGYYAGQRTAHTTDAQIKAAIRGLSIAEPTPAKTAEMKHTRVVEERDATPEEIALFNKKEAEFKQRQQERIWGKKEEPTPTATTGIMPMNQTNIHNPEVVATLVQSAQSLPGALNAVSNITSGFVEEMKKKAEEAKKVADELAAAKKEVPTNETNGSIPPEVVQKFDTRMDIIVNTLTSLLGVGDRQLSNSTKPAQVVTP